MGCILIFAILLLSGCRQTSRENKTEVKVDDIIITNPDTIYYTNQDGTLYPSSDAIVVCGYN